jgi:hypothetical protein
METIEFYFKKYLSDKWVNTFDGVSYSDIYNELFNSRRHNNIKLLEIGIGTLNPTHSNMLFWKDHYKDYQPGASLRAFRDYFPHGLIYGIDIASDCMINENRIFTFLINSTDAKQCDEFLPEVKFDFIIDDGDHNYISQIKTFENFFGKLNNNGIYILEDLESPDKLVEYFSQTSYRFKLRNGLIIIRK